MKRFIIWVLVLGFTAGWLVWLPILALRSYAAPQGTVTWPQISLQLLQGGLVQPVHIAHAGDGSGRLFIVEQPGRIRIIKNGTLLSTPFLDIQGRVGSGASEQGLLSVAFAPDYAQSGTFYVNYTDNDGDTVIARYRVSADPDVADPNSEEILLTIDQPFANHNGGQLAFSPRDLQLYIGTGDGGSAGDPLNAGQRGDTLLGKILRIDVATNTYTIPPDNPFVGDPAKLDEIWALGLRNPWRFSFDRQTGDLYIADVGQGSREEIDFQPAASTGGENYGWRCKEGTQDFNFSGDCANQILEPPIYEYGHAAGDCSVTGGFLYRGIDYCTMQRVYFFGDYCTGRIWGLQQDGATWQSQELLDSDLNITSFGEDEAGNLYVADHGGGIYQITAGSAAPYPDLADPAGIGLEDIAAIAGRWRQQPGDTNPLWDARFDVNDDGETNVVDVMEVIVAQGQSCP